VEKHKIIQVYTPLLPLSMIQNIDNMIQKIHLKIDLTFGQCKLPIITRLLFIFNGIGHSADLE